MVNQFLFIAELFKLHRERARKQKGYDGESEGFVRTRTRSAKRHVASAVAAYELCVEFFHNDAECSVI
jgi:hypothetical protein